MQILGFANGNDEPVQLCYNSPGQLNHMQRWMCSESAEQAHPVYLSPFACGSWMINANRILIACHELVGKFDRQFGHSIVNGNIF